MTIQQISNHSSIADTQFATVSQWKNRSVVLVDKAYLDKQVVNAGVGPGMFDRLFDGLGRTVILTASIFAGAVSAITAWITTGSLLSAAICFGVVGGIGGAVYLYLRNFHPKF